MGRNKIDIDIQEVERLAARGLSVEQIADSLGINKATIFRRQKVEQALRQALASGRAKGIADVANKLMESAQNGNVVAQIFYLKARGGWVDQPKETPEEITIRWESEAPPPKK